MATLNLPPLRAREGDMIIMIDTLMSNHEKAQSSTVLEDNDLADGGSEWRTLPGLPNFDNAGVLRRGDSTFLIMDGFAAGLLEIVSAMAPDMP